MFVMIFIICKEGDLLLCQFEKWKIKQRWPNIYLLDFYIYLYMYFVNINYYLQENKLLFFLYFHLTMYTAYMLLYEKCNQHFEYVKISRCQVLQQLTGIEMNHK